MVLIYLMFLGPMEESKKNREKLKNHQLLANQKMVLIVS